MYKKLFLGMAALSLLAACQNDDLSGGGNEYEPIVMTKTETELASQGADFAFRFFRAVDKSLQENGGLPQEERDEPLFVSPLSASFALSMLANGADGETLQELTDALGFSGYSMEEVNAYYKKLAEELPKQDKQSRLALANSLWLDAQFDALATYKGVLTDSYDAEVRQVDMATAMDDINNWCSQKTNGLIPEILKKNEAGLSMLLLNALYFKGEWDEPFDVEDTQEDVFANADGTESRAAFMNKEDWLRYVQNDLFGMVSLPYGNGAFSLQVLLPHEGMALADCMEALNGNAWTDLLNEMSFTEVNLKLPKLKTDRILDDLRPALEAMGVKKAFAEGADFSKLSGQSLFISLVRQAVSFNMDEKGTEAAAVTAVGGVSAAPPPSPVIDFHVQRPFLLVLTEKSTGCVLFIGKVVKM